MLGAHFKSRLKHLFSQHSHLITLCCSQHIKQQNSLFIEIIMSTINDCLMFLIHDAADFYYISVHFCHIDNTLSHFQISLHSNIEKCFIFNAALELYVL